MVCFPEVPREPRWQRLRHLKMAMPRPANHGEPDGTASDGQPVLGSLTVASDGKPRQFQCCGRELCPFQGSSERVILGPKPATSLPRASGALPREASTHDSTDDDGGSVHEQGGHEHNSTAKSRPTGISEDRLRTVRANYSRAYRAGDTLLSDILAKLDARRGKGRAAQCSTKPRPAPSPCQRTPRR